MAKDKDIKVNYGQGVTLEYHYDKYKVYVIYENQIRRVFDLNNYSHDGFYDELENFIETEITKEKDRKEFANFFKEKFVDNK